ncbi:TonB-dependent receptor [Methylomonas sp. LL1]|uniref:TonB-dependent receptor n=1 Tax=Methylomonas sp. LL1 TaxID=2785785 RepID=UPI001E3D76FE|nr:TonB-dependent receptor plug domain-containing protein [Methylomonas sp. LL1]
MLTPLAIGLGIALGMSFSPAQAHSVDPDKAEELESVEVEEDGRGRDLIGIAETASQGEVSQKQFENRPLSRNGELIEVVPGAVATQHSGSGKANQYFLRGFNLDHGTDFTTYVDGIPMNMTTHAHGQGYMDINSIIPELVEKVEYGKGPYYAEVGDFAAAGYAKMHTMNKLKDGGIAKFTAGEYDYYRGLVANSNSLGDGDLLYAAEFNLYDGVWNVPEDTKRFNGMLRYTLDRHDWGMAINGKAYSNSWTATNQIPQYAIDGGALGLYDSMDPTDGGSSNRYSLSGNFWQTGKNWKNDANIYALYTDLDLYSNFSGHVLSSDNPCNQAGAECNPDGDMRTYPSDQIFQTERRVQVGGNFDHTRYNKVFGFEMDNTVGIQLRHDQIMDLGLYQTSARQIMDTVSKSDVGVTTIGTYLKNHTHWHEKFRTITGLRADFINNDVRVRDTMEHDSAVSEANSGSRGKVMLSPKMSVVIGPWYDTEYFVNAGYGYHSNDARGTSIRRDPTNGEFLDAGSSRIDPAAWSRGAEVGVRSNFIPGLNTTVAAWWLNSSNELVFVGDAGTTEINGASDRYGIEWTNYYKPTDWMTLDFDYAVTTARFADVPDGATDNYIPNSVGRVISTGILVEDPTGSTGLFGTLRFRHFGHVPLDESGTFWAGDTNIVNLGAGIKRKNYKIEIDVFNILGSESNDIAYAYDSSYPNGADTVNGIMKHPVEPRMVRGTITVNF